jgi:hypothetical protein
MGMKAESDMKHANVAKQLGQLDKVVGGLPGTDGELQLTVIYEDALTWRWARTACDQIEGSAQAHATKCTWWKLDDFSAPGVLAGAVSKAMRADMIIVALRAKEGLPMSFYVWANSWLPHRFGRGAMLAFDESLKSARGNSGRVARYLRTLARQARLEFINWNPQLLLDVTTLRPGFSADFHSLTRLLAGSQAWS